jgi:hypothetical protein
MSFGTCTTARVSVRSLEVMSLISLPAPTLPVHRGVSSLSASRSTKLSLRLSLRRAKTGVYRANDSPLLDWGNRREGRIYREN